MEELLDGVYMAPTYGNTLMGLAPPTCRRPHDDYKITYYAPQPRAVVEVVDFDDPTRSVAYGADRPRHADDADEGVLHAAASSSATRASASSRREVSVGRRQRRAAVPGSSRRRRRSACIEEPRHCGARHSKLSASFVSPLPLYPATCG